MLFQIFKNHKLRWVEPNHQPGNEDTEINDAHRGELDGRSVSSPSAVFTVSDQSNDHLNADDYGEDCHGGVLKALKCLYRDFWQGHGFYWFNVGVGVGLFVAAVVYGHLIDAYFSSSQLVELCRQVVEAS